MFNAKKILITGGLGFIGSNLAIRLVKDNAYVTVFDNLNPLYGGNKFNIQGIENSIKVVIGDVRDENIVKPLIEKSDYIFHFAAQVSYIDSLSMPYEDMDLNARTTLFILELCRKYNPKVKIVFSSSRMVLGQTTTPLFDELAPTNPLSLYGIHKLTSEKYLLMYYKDFCIKSTIFRITNPYGPRQQIKHSKYSLPGWFIRQAMEGNTIKIFGSGNQVRDYIYVSDIIESIYLTVPKHESDGEIINLGSGTATKFKDMVKTIVDIVGKGKIEHIPWPDNYEKIETGDSVADITKLKNISSFSPKTTLRVGVEKTFKYYTEYAQYYTK